MNAFVKVCRNNHFKVPLTEEMMYYYLSLGFKCWVIGINGLYLINNKNDAIINISTFDESDTFRKDGYSKINKIFNNNLNAIIEELNTYLYDDIVA